MEDVKVMNTVPMSQSRTIQTRLVFPSNTNHHTSIFGGTMLSYIDEIASIAAMKHSRGEVVTASLDNVNFLSPAFAGEIIELEAVVIATGRTSMDVFIKVKAQNVVTGEEKVTMESYVTMVSIDENGKPKAVPTVYPETDEENQLFVLGLSRQKQRKEKKAVQTI